METEPKDTQIILKLGDIIEIDAPSNNDLNEQTFFIDYIDSTIIVILNISTLKYTQLNVNEDNIITDESIRTIYLLNRSDAEGYARQNGLLPKTWVNVHIGGEFPTIITGEITNLEQDMIEITTFPELDVIYIDFGYQGIPRNIPFKKFEIRPKPAIIPKNKDLIDLRESAEEGEILEENEEFSEEGKPSMSYSAMGELIIDVPEGAVADKSIHQILDEAFLSAEDITFGEQLEDITQVVEIPESQRKYGIELQTNDLIDELLSTIPNSQRSKEIMSKVHELIERFKQLRQSFSQFDDNGNVIGYIQLGALHKPLIERIETLDTKIKWILPVVKQKRMLYGGVKKDEVLYDDTIFSNIDEELVQTQELIENYRKGTLPTITNKYENLYSKLLDIQTSVVSEKCDECLVSEKDIHTNLEAIINNLDDFYSTSNKTSKREENDQLVKTRFVIQRYNLGMNIKSKTILKSGKIVYVNKPMTTNDKMSVSSLMMLPEPVVKFSQIDLPGTNIMTKSNLHMNYLCLYKLLRKNVDINTHIVDDLKNEIAYLDNEESEEAKSVDGSVSLPEFISNIKEYSLDDSLEDKPNKFHDFLNVIVPKTRLIFRIIRKYIKDKLSFVEIVKELEPFYVYSKDISYQQYNEIRFYIKNQIIQYRKTLTEKMALFRNLRTMNYAIPASVNVIRQILSENRELFEMFEDAYNFKDMNINTISNSELLCKINNKDNSKLFSDIITTAIIKILSTPDLLDVTQPAKIDDMSETQKIQSKNCSRKNLTKKYSKMSDLRSDNGQIDVFYDKEYDTTNYSILDSYKSQQKDMESAVFLEFLTKSLIHKHDVSEKDADTMAATLIEGKRRVKDGEYCILEIKVPISENTLTSNSGEGKSHVYKELDKLEYFRRSRNHWVHDTTINEEAFLDTSSILCNISDDCFYNSKKNNCESVDQTAHRLSELEKKRMRDEFNLRITESIEQLDEKIKATLKQDFKNLVRLHRLLDVQREKFNNIAYEIGKYTQNDVPVVVSPHMKLRDMIMSQDDFQKKQSDIVKLVDLFCREPMIDELNEDIYWLYCKETNTKLFPQSIYKLAYTFVSGGNYSAKLDEICRTHGVLSDDGDSIIDKHSSYLLKKIDFVSEEMYTEEGFKITSHDIMEDDLDVKLMKIMKTTAATNKLAKSNMIFENEKNQIVYNILFTLCNNIGLPIESIQDFVLRTTEELMMKHIQSEDIYEQKAALLEKKKGVRPIPYEIYKNRLMFWIIGSSLFIAVQTAIPSLHLKKTFPGCVRSFSGYPLSGGIEDLSGIEYIACVLYKTKSSISPWNSIERLDVKTYVVKIRETIEKLILPDRPDIDELYTKKKEYLLLHLDDNIPEIHNINRWKLFLPPIVPVGTIKNLRGVTGEFEKELVNLVNKQHQNQQEYLGIVQHKIRQYGYAIVDEINKIVNSKELLLKTSGKIPFIENACCNTGDLIPMQYFVHENALILEHVQQINRHTEIMQTYRELCTPFIYHHSEFTGIHYSVVSHATRVENIYNAFFYYCNFNNDLSIPEPYRTLCPEKPNGYKRTMSLLDKIDFMKVNGKQYTEENLQQLMAIVRNKNTIEIDHPIVYQQVDVIRDLLESFERKESLIIDANFRKHLNAVLRVYNPQRMVKESRPELDRFKNYLVKANERMYYAIVEFIDKHGNLSDVAFSNFQDWLLNIFSISDIENQTSNLNDLIYKKVQSIKNSIYNMTRVYPTIILNQKIYSHIPEHWELSSIHNQDLENFIENYWSTIQSYFGDAVLENLFKDIQVRLMDVYLMVMELPVYSPIMKHDLLFHSLFDTETIIFVYTYFLYTTIYEYIVASESSELLRMDVEQKKTERRQIIQSNRDESTVAESMISNINENTIEYNNDIQEIDIRIGNQDELQHRVAQLLLSFVEIEKENMTNAMTYADIAKKINLSKKQEKKRLTDYLGNLPLDEREIEDQFKKYKMGRWNVGLQKGLVEYDADVYLREREEVAMEEMNFRNAAMDVDELEREANRALAEEHDQEGMDIGEYGENYQDGEYYAEDHDPEDRYD